MFHKMILFTESSVPNEEANMIIVRHISVIQPSEALVTATDADKIVLPCHFCHNKMIVSKIVMASHVQDGSVTDIYIYQLQDTMSSWTILCQCISSPVSTLQLHCSGSAKIFWSEL